jgi:hypothetical protein
LGRRIVIILLVLLVSGLVVIGFYFSERKEELSADLYKSITPKVLVVLETIDIQNFFNSVTTEKGLPGELFSIKNFEKFNIKLKYLADQFNKEWFRKISTEKKAVIAFYYNNEKLQPVLSIPVPGNLRQRQVKELLKTAGIKNILEERSKRNSYIRIPYEISGQRDTLTILIKAGQLFCSESKQLINDALGQLEKSNDVRSVPGFSKVLLASGKNEDKLFVVFPNLMALFNKFLKNESGITGMISKLAGSAEADIYLNSNGLVISGYTESQDSTEILYRYKNILPRELHSYKILPSSTALFETFIVSDNADKNIADTSFSERAKVLAGKMKVYQGSEVTRALLDIKNMSVEDNSLIIYELKNSNMAEQIFLEESGGDIETFNYQPDDQTKISIYKALYKGFPKILFSNLSSTSDEQYFAFFNNYLIAGYSVEAISKLLYDNILNRTLVNDISYRDFESTLAGSSGYYLYFVPVRIINFLSKYINDDILDSIGSNRGSLSKIQAAGYQLAASNNMLYNSFSVMFKDVIREESSTQWETLLDTVASIKPFFFLNNVTGAKEIFVQDLRNNIYLINAAGRVLWKVPLNERIIGQIYMIDYFRNGKYQLLFSGKNYLHLIDRNGNYVERYPVKLRSPASNSLALFDYDNNLNYRLFIAGEDQKIYLYDKTGNVVKGWNQFKTATPVISEIYYFKEGGKDYIVAADETSVYMLDRSGNKRVNLKDQAIKAKGSTIRMIQGYDASLIFSTPDGTIQQVFFDGKVKKTLIKQFSGNHLFDFFDIDGDGFGEYIFIDNGMLYLYDRNKMEVFTREFASENLVGPICFTFSAYDRKIGIFENDGNLIYLIGKNGENMNGFPLKGASLFSVGKLSAGDKWNLIVGGTDNFLYNYLVE